MKFTEQGVEALTTYAMAMAVPAASSSFFA